MPGRVAFLSFSSRLGPKLSLKSVLRLRREAGGEEIVGSSLENLLLVGEINGLLFWSKSPPDSRRLGAGRLEGELFIGF